MGDSGENVRRRNRWTVPIVRARIVRYQRRVYIVIRECYHTVRFTAIVTAKVARGIVKIVYIIKQAAAEKVDTIYTRVCFRQIHGETLNVNNRLKNDRTVRRNCW